MTTALNPPTWVAGTRTADEARRERKAAKAARKTAAPLAQANVICQCDGCGATADVEDRLGRMRHDGCSGTFRLYGAHR